MLDVLAMKSLSVARAGSHTLETSTVDGRSEVVCLVCGCRMRGLGEIALEKECAHIQRKLQQALHGHRFKLVTELRATVDTLVDQLDHQRPDVFQISAHGGDVQCAAAGSSAGARDVKSSTGDRFGVYLLDDEGLLRFVSGESLAAMIGASAPQVRVVVLNACHSDQLADALLRVVDCVIAMSGPIDDRAAVSFSPAFYRALGNDRSVGTAFDQAVATLAGLPDEQRPKLRYREGVNPYQLHLLRATRTQESLPRPEFDAGKTRTVLRSPALRIGLLVAVIALAVFAVGAAAAAVLIHDAGRQTLLSSPPAPDRLGTDPSRPAVKPAGPEVPAPDTKAMGDGARDEALGQLPGPEQKRVVASRALPVRAPQLTNAGPSRQQLTAPAADVPPSAPTIATVASQGRSPDELGKQTVRRFVLREIDRLRGCYEDQLHFVPTLAGPVLAQFLINPAGAVTSSSAKGLGDAVDFCVAGVLRDIRFPSSSSSVLVRYPFVFRLAKPKRGTRATPTIGPEMPDVQRSPNGLNSRQGPATVTGFAVQWTTEGGTAARKRGGDGN